MISLFLFSEGVAVLSGPLCSAGSKGGVMWGGVALMGAAGGSNSQSMRQEDDDGTCIWPSPFYISH